jgi:site-specific DNA recombinase
LDDRTRGTRDNIQAERFAFVGLIQCGHCGCAMSAQIQKEKYIYYHCTGAKRDCGEPYVREEVIDKQFADAIASIKLPAELQSALLSRLRASHGDIARHHAEAVAKLTADCARLQRRLDTIYVDKLEGLIDEETYRRNAARWQDEIAAARKSIAQHDSAKQTYVEEAITLLHLAQELPDLCARQPAHEKRELLRYVVSNSYWAAKELTIEFKKPFLFLAEWAAEHKDEPPVEPGSNEGSFCMVDYVGPC